MELYPESLESLIGELSKLPTIGRKSAERLAMNIVKRDKEDVMGLVKALVDVKEKIHPCRLCGNLTENDLCDICSNPKRDRSTITVVEDTSNLLAIERSQEYRGLYHVLGGLISPMADISADDISLDKLIQRMDSEDLEEVILALNPTVEGETTSLFLKEVLKDYPVRLTRIASGIPMGASLSYFDSDTLTRALEERRPLD